MLELTQLSRSGSTAKAIGKLRGFTLIELMITVAILGILATIALPAFTGILATTRVNSAATDLWSAMQFARSEAVRNNRTFTLCATTDGTSCAAAGTSFSNGWLVRQGPAVLPTGAPVTSPTRVYPALRPTINVTGSAPIEYSSLGRPISTTVSVAFNITAPANRTRYVCIVNSGLPEVRNTPC